MASLRREPASSSRRNHQRDARRHAVLASLTGTGKRCCYAVLFLLFAASGLWALLPQQARRGLGTEFIWVWSVACCLGIGAIAGAWLLPSLRKRFATNQLVARRHHRVCSQRDCSRLRSFISVLAVALVVAGAAWISVLASLNIAAQTATPSWVRARVLAVYY